MGYTCRRRSSSSNNNNNDHSNNSDEDVNEFRGNVSHEVTKKPAGFLYLCNASPLCSIIHYTIHPLILKPDDNPLKKAETCSLSIIDSPSIKTA
jgi:hypothetical protein